MSRMQTVEESEGFERLEHNDYRALFSFGNEINIDMS